MVPLLLRKFAYAVYELEGFAKVGKLEHLRDVMVFNDVPAGNLRLESGEFLTVERGHAPTAGNACFGR